MGSAGSGMSLFIKMLVAATRPTSWDDEISSGACNALAWGVREWPSPPYANRVALRTYGFPIFQILVMVARFGAGGTSSATELGDGNSGGDSVSISSAGPTGSMVGVDGDAGEPSMPAAMSRTSLSTASKS